jgi:AAA domain
MRWLPMSDVSSNGHRPLVALVEPWDQVPLPDDPQEVVAGLRRVSLTPASAIKPRPVRWLWEQRLALGTLGLLAGREGLGKSTLAYWVAAQVTRGLLPGEFAGRPSSVIVAATEDSWEHTIVPRLIAAGADLHRVFRVEVYTATDVLTGLVLPRDLHGLEQVVTTHDVALTLLDPLSSRLSEDLDSHRDPEVRRALEPLAALADRTRSAVLGLAHHNKSGSSDPLTLILGSRAFAAVARSVSTVVKDPDDDTDTVCLFGTPKNNLGRTDLPVLSFRIVGHTIDTDEGPATTGAVDWLGESQRTIGDAIAADGQSADDRSATSEAGAWLSDYLVTEGGRALSADIKREGVKAGHTHDSLKRARRRLGLGVEHVGFPRVTYWAAPVGAQLEQPAWGASPTALTTPTGGQSEQSEQLEQSAGAPARDAPTGRRP